MNFEKFGKFCYKIYDEDTNTYIVTYRDYAMDITFHFDKYTYDKLANQEKNTDRRLSRMFKLVKGIEQDVSNK